MLEFTNPQFQRPVSYRKQESLKQMISKLLSIGVRTWLLRSALVSIIALLSLAAAARAQSQNQSQAPLSDAVAPADSTANSPLQVTPSMEAAAIPSVDSFSLAAA